MIAVKNVDGSLQEYEVLPQNDYACINFVDRYSIHRSRGTDTRGDICVWPSPFATCHPSLCVLRRGGNCPFHCKSVEMRSVRVGSTRRPTFWAQTEAQAQLRRRLSSHFADMCTPFYPMSRTATGGVASHDPVELEHVRSSIVAFVLRFLSM